MFEELVEFYKKILFKLTIGYGLSNKTLKTLFCKVSEYFKYGQDMVMYGKISEPIVNFSQLPEVIVKDIRLQKSKLLETPIGNYELAINVNQGDTVIALVPINQNVKVYKGDGFDKEIPFDSEPFGCNGEVVITLFNKQYKVFGELMLVSGRLTIYTKEK